jgi:uncharacterized protein (TIGR03435 family)
VQRDSPGRIHFPVYTIRNDGYLTNRLFSQEMRLSGRMAPLIVLTACVLAQIPQFEAATVKPTDRGAAQGVRMRGGPGSSYPGQIDYSNVPLMTLLRNAYQAQAFQISGPTWLSTETFDIAAKVPAGTTSAQLREMLASLIIERFQISMHRETRQVNGYELVVAKNSPKFKPAIPVSPVPTPATRPQPDADGFVVAEAPGAHLRMGMEPGASKPTVYLTFRAQPLAGLVQTIGEELQSAVADRTGLSGLYDFKIKFTPQQGGMPPAALTTDETAIDILNAVQNQLGLKLTAKKVLIEAIVIDRINKTPTAN